jgi:2-polyprenyl-3-methyl-5-hydroxy-6-metoxy-1,4-benzoquinol methylase
MPIPDPPTSDHAADEARFWGKRQTPDLPDHRLRARASSPQELWEDPEVEAIARGRYVERILDSCPPPRMEILELACGCGWLSLELARRGHNVKGIDLSAERIQSAREYAALVRVKEDALGRLEYEVADLTTIPLPRTRYDRIVCWDGLHHIAPIEPLMREIHEALRPGGLLLLFDHIGPASRTLGRLDGLMAGLVVLLCQPRNLARLARGHERTERSASEDVTGIEMVDAAARRFGRSNMQAETTLGFGKRWLARLRGPRGVRLPVVRAICSLDRFWIRSGLLRGEYVFVIARKCPEGATGHLAGSSNGVDDPRATSE